MCIIMYLKVVVFFVYFENISILIQSRQFATSGLLPIYFCFVAAIRRRTPPKLFKWPLTHVNRGVKCLNVLLQQIVCWENVEDRMFGSLLGCWVGHTTFYVVASVSHKTLEVWIDCQMNSEYEILFIQI